MIEGPYSLIHYKDAAGNCVILSPPDMEKVWFGDGGTQRQKEVETLSV